MARVMKLKLLQGELEDVSGFEYPNVMLEQYVTTPEIASSMLHRIQLSYQDIEDKIVADLGCGCGVLSIGSAILGCGYCVGFDIDSQALQIYQRNLEQFEIDNVDVVQIDVSKITPGDPVWQDKVDTVVMNPPFGTKQNEGIDMHFLKVALTMAKNSVYSLHKSSTRKYITKMCHKLGVEVSFDSELRYNLDKSYKFHKAKSVDIQVDFVRCTFKNKKTFIQCLKKELEMLSDNNT